MVYSDSIQMKLHVVGSDAFEVCEFDHLRNKSSSTSDLFETHLFHVALRVLRWCCADGTRELGLVDVKLARRRSEAGARG